jgi:MFS family permease
MAGFAEFYIQAFAVFLKATNMQLGLISGLPTFLGALSQVFSAKLVKFFGTKRRFVSLAALIQAHIWIPILLVAYMNVSNPASLLIVLFSIYFVCGSIGVPAWSSWMAELVNISSRGTYFGSRNKITGFVSFFSYILGGIVLHYSELFMGSPLLGFSALMVLGYFARVASSFMLSRQYEPTVQFTEEKINFADFLSHLTKENYGYLTLFLVLMNFCVFIAAPYFVAYMLKDLQLSYLMFMALNAVALIVKYIFMPIWGRMSDEYGTLKILALSSFLVPFVPVLWIFSRNIFYLAGVQFFSGFAWAGFELGSFNFLLDTANPNKRIQYISYYNVLNGLFVLLGSLFGGLLLKFNNFAFSKYYVVFFVSGMLRYAVTFVLLPKLKEVRPVAEVKYQHMLFRMALMFPSMGVRHHIFAASKKHKL